jgi:hypothetical protein
MIYWKNIKQSATVELIGSTYYEVTRTPNGGTLKNAIYWTSSDHPKAQYELQNRANAYLELQALTHP